MSELTPEMCQHTLNFGEYCRKYDEAKEILMFVGVVAGEKLYMFSCGDKNSKNAEDRQRKVTNCLIDLCAGEKVREIRCSKCKKYFKDAFTQIKIGNNVITYLCPECQDRVITTIIEMKWE